MALEITEEKAGEVRILALTGRLDTETAPDFELKAHDQFTEGDRHFIIDLSGIDYVSSAGLRVLLALAKQVDGTKGSMKLCGLASHVRQVFDLAGFSKLLNIHSTLKNCVADHEHADINADEIAEMAKKLLGDRADAAPVSTPAPSASPAMQSSAASLLGAPTVETKRAKPGLWARFMGWLRGE